MLISNGKQEAQVTVELEEFLRDNTKPFVTWLWQVLQAFATGSDPNSISFPNNKRKRDEDHSEKQSKITSKGNGDDILEDILEDDYYKDKKQSSSPDSEIKDKRNDRDRDRDRRDYERSNRDRRYGKDSSSNYRVREGRDRDQDRSRDRDRDRDDRDRFRSSSDRKRNVVLTRDNSTYKKRSSRDDENQYGFPESRDDEAVSFTITLGADDSSKKDRTENRRVVAAIKDTDEDEKEEGHVDKKRKLDSYDAEILKRCAFWPNCRRDDCPFVHPVENCKNFPNCTHGDKCLYLHPSIPCKFGSSCTRQNCAYTHPPPSAAIMPPKPAVVPHCRYGFSCTRADCSFAHPPKPCKFGLSCAKGNMCNFAHSPPCKWGEKCSKPGCSFSHYKGNASWKKTDQLAHNTDQTSELPEEDETNETTTDVVIT
eukprot:TRINITY_DN1836_c0_g3_i1.p1 TRINITY_DN1836_c0_g3~~TRINITY_DN1836_c0_g3_i1.p1  ORF type:complete len:425 (-),score=76.09 TRINITY_DN1836_c0_g3_i1:606-1880(-)